MTFLDLNKTYGWKTIPYDVSLLPVNRVDFNKDFGLENLTASSINSLKVKLEANDDFAYNYLVSKLGFVASDPAQFEEAMMILVDDIGVLTKSKRKTYKYIC
jgi:hypothetical protein